jgi:hypothetical protein
VIYGVVVLKLSYFLLNSLDSHVSKSRPRKRLARSASVSPDAAEGIDAMGSVNNTRRKLGKGNVVLEKA